MQSPELHSPSGAMERPKVRHHRTCLTMDQHRRLAQRSPEYRCRRRQIEFETRDFTARHGAEGLRTGVVRIPVVVHVVWNTTAQNVSDTQIRSQIDVLNADFRRTNADAANVPRVFAGVAADARIEFALAVRDPQCGATSGITRTFTRTVGVTLNTVNDVKSAATGGVDPWPADRYLNMWVTNFTDNTLGWGTYPGQPAETDGVVIATTAFGTTGTATAPFHLGRTATHEVGHWLNLIHIWGDDQFEPDVCSGSDECADTPNQGRDNSGRPTFPRISCGNGPNGDMFMNYMDYVDDEAMFMFTQDQVTRMQAALSVARAGILASDALVPSGVAQMPALWMQDNADDTGAEPDPSTRPMWISDDIWVRNGPDGLSVQDHQNPLAEQTNFVYVRVRNRGCRMTAARSGELKLYWAKASSSLSWPAPWDGSVTSPALMGGMIGSQVVAVAGGSQAILTFEWTPPDPSDYASFGADKAHFCLLARIETSSTPPYGMTSPETSNLYANVQNNNKIVWKNITIVDMDGDGGRFASVVVGALGHKQQALHLVFDAAAPRPKLASLFEWGYVIVELAGALAHWGKDCKGVEQLADGRLVVTRSGAELQGPPLKKGEFGTLQLRFVPDARHVVGTHILELDVAELDSKRNRLGGQRVLLRTADGREPVKWDTQLGTFDGVAWTPKAPCGCDD